jgi:hypothetical protein
MPARQTMTRMFSVILQCLQSTELSDEKKKESAVAKVIAVGFGLLWAIVVWYTLLRGS